MAAARFLVDTIVISELRKRRRSNKVVEWIASLPDDGAYISVVTIGEIAKGIAKRRGFSAHEREADELQAWFEGLLAQYADRILPINVPVAVRWGRLCNEHPQLATDMLIAATALEHELTVATRNVAHFRATGAHTFNPFQ